MTATSILLPPEGTRRRLTLPQVLAITSAHDLGGVVPANLELRGGRWRLRFRIENPEGGFTQRRSLTLPSDPDAADEVRAALCRNQAERLHTRSAYHAARKAEAEARQEKEKARRRLEASALACYGGSRRKRRKLRKALAFAALRSRNELEELVARVSSGKSCVIAPASAKPVPKPSSEAVTTPVSSDERTLLYHAYCPHRMELPDLVTYGIPKAIEIIPPDNDALPGGPPEVVRIQEPPPDSPPDWRWRLMQAHPEALLTQDADEAMAIFGDEFLAHWICPCVRRDRLRESKAPVWYGSYGETLQLHQSEAKLPQVPSLKTQVELFILGGSRMGNVFGDRPCYPCDKIAYWLYELLFWDVGWRSHDAGWIARHVFLPLLNKAERGRELIWKLIAYHLGGEATEHDWFLMRSIEPNPPGYLDLLKRTVDEAVYFDQLWQLGLVRRGDQARRAEWMSAHLVGFSRSTERVDVHPVNEEAMDQTSREVRGSFEIANGDR